MDWAVRFEQKEGTWGVVWQETEHEEWKSITSTSPRIRKASQKKKQLTTDFCSWTLASAAQVSSITGLPSTANHECFLFQHEGVTYLVPSFSFIQGVFRPLKSISTWLFKLCGLEQLVTPAKDEWPYVDLLVSNGPGQLEQKIGLKTFLGWVWAYPSARAMWTSVYASISQGKIAVQLPQGTGRFTVTGEMQNDVFVVNSLTLTRLTTSELPFMGGDAQEQTLVFHGTHEPKSSTEEFEKALIRDFSARPCKLTDQEWLAIEPLIPALHRFELNPKLVLEGIVGKLATGLPWRKSTYSAGTYLNACQAYRRWKRNGTWERICRTLGTQDS